MDKATSPRARDRASGTSQSGHSAATPSPRATRRPREAAPAPLAVGDLLVFELRDGTLRLVGGRGRGQGWAGIVEASLADEPLARRAARGNVPVRVTEEEPVRVVGPYWSKDAALVAVGDEHLVVFGDTKRLRASDGELRREAAEAVSRAGGIPSSKLLADELEVVDAVRKLMDYRPQRLTATARHVADVAAASLSCDFAALLVPGPDGPVVALSGAPGEECVDPELCQELTRLAGRLGDEPLLEQHVPDGGRLGRDGGLVTRYALGIGTGRSRGMLVVGHDAAHPRGFTLLCQRVGRALADAAEVLLGQAAGREELAAERDRFARESRTDDLTGLANRVAWTEALDSERKRRSRYRRPVVVMSIDVDGLKDVNDTYGHVAGDEMLRGVAEVLLASLRESDFVARIGGDEFGVLLPETSAEATAPIIERIHAGCRAWRGSHEELRLSLSIGWAAPEPFGDLQEALRTADRRMYASKRAG